MIRLVEKYKSLGKRDEALKWLEHLLGQKAIATEDLFYCAHNLEDLGEDQKALKAYKGAAERKKHDRAGRSDSTLGRSRW